MKMDQYHLVLNRSIYSYGQLCIEDEFDQNNMYDSDKHPESISDDSGGMVTIKTGGDTEISDYELEVITKVILFKIVNTDIIIFLLIYV